MPKRKHVETSKEAELSKSLESERTDYARIVSALTEIEKGHYEDIAKHCGIDELSVISRRLKEAIQLKLIRNTGEKKLTSRLRNAYVYALYDENAVQVVTEKETKKKLKDTPTISDLSKNIAAIGSDKKVVVRPAHYKKPKQDNQNFITQNLFEDASN